MPVTKLPVLFPAHAGMNRENGTLRQLTSSVPRTRGDEPRAC